MILSLQIRLIDGLHFMESWDHFDSNKQLQEWTEQWATEALRVIKPGGIMLCFGAPRTFHRIACGIENAGWILKDTIMYVFGSGFPKAFDVGKAVDKKLGNKREITGNDKSGKPETHTTYEMGKQTQEGENTFGGKYDVTKGNSKWEGYKSPGLKPAYEPIIMAMKPKDGTYAENALKWDVAGINVDGARIPLNGDKKMTGGCKGTDNPVNYNFGKPFKEDNTKGRFPANLILDNSKEVKECFPNTQSGGVGTFRKAESLITEREVTKKVYRKGDSGSASRYFKRIKYCSKASKAERNKGCGGLEDVDGGHYRQDEWSRRNMGNTPDSKRKPVKNDHPCVKPVALLEYLVELTKMPNEDQIYLDPFVGSGTTAIAVGNKNRNYIGIEKNEHYCKIARARIKASRKQLKLF